MNSILLLYSAAALLSWDLAGVRSTSTGLDSQWEGWKEKYGKIYSSSEEEIERRAVWERNLAFIQEHNSKRDRTFDVAMNEFGDQSRMTSKHQTVTYRSSQALGKSDGSLAVGIPDSVDWRKKGDVTPVENQGQLGSAVAYAAADAVASYHAIHTGSLALLSAEEVQDCCRSHIPDGIFDCIHQLGGLCTDTAYKTTNGTCASRSCTPFAKVPTGGKKVKSGSEYDLAVAVAIEPVMVAIDASHISFQLYHSGVYVSNDCSSTQLDHNMLVVGYGQTAGQDYWICKNSWGVSWGMDGYILMARNRGNMCGIATDASYPY